MEALIDEYFELCDAEKRPYTVPGLCYHLDFTDRHALLNYKGKPGFDAVIKRALRRMERSLAERMQKPGQPIAGLIFLAKNWFGYRDSKDLAVSHSYDKDVEKVDFTGRVKRKSEQDQELIH
jgi:hypothetical protein